jgi:hypothetical protein
MHSTPEEREDLRSTVGTFVSLLRDLRDLFAEDGESREASRKLLESVADRFSKLSKGLAVTAFLALVFVVLLLERSCAMGGRMDAVTAELVETTRLLEAVRAESATKQQVQDVQAQVAAVADEQPKVEIRAADAGAGRTGKPTAVVVVRPASKPSTPKSPPAPAVEIPIVLPPGSRVEDAGAP